MGESRSKPARTFLRKGTREHLSSGIDRKAQPKKKSSSTANQGKARNHDDSSFYQNETLKDSYNMDRDLTPKNRSTSQNRVLNKKKDDISVNKAPKIDTREKKQFVKHDNFMN